MYSPELFQNIWMQKIVRGWGNDDKRAVAKVLESKIMSGMNRNDAERDSVALVQAMRRQRKPIHWPSRPAEPSAPTGMASGKVTRLAIKTYNQHGKRI